VQVTYALEWKADRLHISLDNRPEDRNYIVFLVVEETFSASGTVLHTALPVPMNGQLTYVPQRFFDDEQAAIEKASRIVLDVPTEHPEIAPVPPEDPFWQSIQPEDLLSPAGAGLQRIAGFARRHEPMQLRQALQGSQSSNALEEGEAPHSQG
jgi:hypothetical protein